MMQLTSAMSGRGWSTELGEPDHLNEIDDLKFQVSVSVPLDCPVS